MGPALGVRADAFQLEHIRWNDFFNPSSCSPQVAASSPSASIPSLHGAGCHFRAHSLLLLPFLAQNHNSIWVFFPLFYFFSSSYKAAEGLHNSCRFVCSADPSPLLLQTRSLRGASRFIYMDLSEPQVEKNPFNFPVLF